jgi:hypothetical protein
MPYMKKETSMPTLPDLHAPLLEWAQWYASLGWPILPCRGKVPLLPDWTHTASTDPAQLAAWWQSAPGANIGGLAGVAWWAIDVDPRAGGDATLFGLTVEHGRLPRTTLSLTGGGGEHYLWALPPGRTVINKAALGEGLDVQAAGSQIILPPSTHPDSGRPYMWDLVDGPDEVLPQPAPDWLLALVTTPQPATSWSVQPQPQGAALPAVDEPIPQGRRNRTLAQYGTTMAQGGMPCAAILAALTVMNTRCVPPLPALDLERIARSTSRYQRPTFLPTTLGAPLPPSPSPTPHDSQSWGTPPPPLIITDLADMLERTYPVPKWLIKALIPEGLIFIIGSPKSSKTYLGYSLALSLSYEAQRGGLWLGHYPITTPGPVVYITLEDDEADSRFRVAELAPWLKTIQRDQLLFVHGEGFPRFDQGLVDVIREQILDRYHPALVVLDPISYLYSPMKRNGDQFSEVRDMLLPLRWLGRAYHCTIAGVDHRRKQSANDIDIFETQYGSVSKGAIADAMFVIVRDDKEITVHARIRKAPDQTLTLGFEFTLQGEAVWTWKGSVDGLVGIGQYGNLRQQVIEILSGAQIPMSMRDILAALNLPDSKHTRDSIYHILFRAQKSQEVQKTTRGQYVWAGGN